MGIRRTFLPGTVILLCLLIGCASVDTAPRAGRTAPSADRERALREIESVIREQLDAFKRDDYTAAFTFVSKAFRKEFPRDQFETMIRARFKEMARPAQTTVRRIRFDRDQTRAVLEVDVAGADARLAAVEYRMIFEEGHWKIDGLKTVDPFRNL